MASVGYATISIIPSAQDFKKKLQKDIGQHLPRTGVQAGGMFNKGFTGSLRKLAGPVAGAVAGIATAAFGAMTMKGGIARALDTEDAIVQMRRMGLEIEQVDQLIDGVDKTFDGTIFSNPQGFKLAGLLHGTNVELERIPGIIGTIADFAAHGNVPLEQMQDIFLQVIGSGRVTADTFNRLTAAGVPIEQLAISMGMTSGEMRELASSGELTADMFLDAAANAEMFQGAAKSAGDTTRGAFSNMLTQTKVLAQQLVNPLISENGPMVVFFKQVREALVAVRPLFKTAGELLGAVMVPALEAAGNAIGAFADRAGEMLPKVQDGVSGLLTLIRDGNFSAELRNAFGWEEDSGIVDFLLRVRDGLVGVTEALRDAFGGEVDSGAGDFLFRIREAFTDFDLSGLASMFAPLLDTFREIGPTLAGAVPQILELATAFSPLGVVLRTLAPVLPTIAEAFVSLASSVLSALAPLIPVVLELAGSVASALVDAMVTLAPVVVEVVTLVGGLLQEALVALQPVLGMLPGLFRQIVPAVLQLIPAVLSIVKALAPLLPVVAELIGSLLPPLSSLLMTVIPIVVELATLLLGALGPAFQAVASVIELIMPAVEWLIRGVVENVIGVIEGLTSFITGVVDFFKAIFSGDFSAAWQAVKDIVFGAVQAVWNFVQLFLVGRLVKGVQGVLTAVRGFFSGAWRNIVGGVRNFGTNIVSSVRGFMDTIRLRIMYALDGVKAFFANAWSAVTGGVRTAFSNIVSSVRSRLTSVIDLVKGLPGRITGALRNMGTLLLNAGRDLIRGFIRGITGMAGNLISSIRSTITDRLPGFVKSALGIQSPSRVFMALGRDTAAGMALGISSGARDVQRAADGLVPSAPWWRSPDVPAGGLAGSFGASRAESARWYVENIHTGADPAEIFREFAWQERTAPL